MSESNPKRSPLPTMEEALREIEAQPFTSALVLSVVLRMSLPMTYRAIQDGSIPSTRVGTKLRIPCAPYRDLMAAKLPMVA